MFRSLVILLIANLFSTIHTNVALAQDAYISEEIGVTMRSGPTNRFRIIGNLRAGTPISILQSDSANKTTQISTKDGAKTGWVKTQYVSQSETVLAKYQALQIEKQELENTTNSLNQELSNKNSIVKQNQELQLKVSELENQVDQLSQQADLQNSRFRKDVFYSGALTVLISMLIAWIITRTIYSRRQSSGWR